MRPTKKTQEPLKTPLNQLLGSEGSIRVLRVLAGTTEPMGRATIARRAELDPAGVRRTLDGLAESGLVEVLGSGRNQAVKLRERHPMAQPIRELFEKERASYEAAVGAIRESIDTLSVPLDAVWLEDPAVRTPGIVDVGVLADGRAADRAARELGERLSELGAAIAVHFVVHPYADVEADLVEDRGHTNRLANVTLLHGWIPWRWQRPGGGPIRSQRDLDARALRLAKAVAERLPNDPAILDEARRWLTRVRESSGARHAAVLDEWQRILENLSIGQIQALLTEDSERARELRQSLPFAEALSPAERAELMERAEE